MEHYFHRHTFLAIQLFPNSSRGVTPAPKLPLLPSLHHFLSSKLLEMCKFCHLLRQAGRGGRGNRGFVSIATPGVSGMSRSFCLCTGRNAAFGGTQGDLVLRLDLLQLPYCRREQLWAVESVVAKVFWTLASLYKGGSRAREWHRYGSLVGSGADKGLGSLGCGRGLP